MEGGSTNKNKGRSSTLKVEQGTGRVCPPKLSPASRLEIKGERIRTCLITTQ